MDFKESGMTDKDKELISEAEKMNCIYWARIEAMSEQADTPEAAKELRQLANRKYHIEEYHSGLI